MLVCKYCGFNNKDDETINCKKCNKPLQEESILPNLNFDKLKSNLYQKTKKHNKFSISNIVKVQKERIEKDNKVFFDPSKKIWLEIYRKLSIFGSILILVYGIYMAFLNLKDIQHFDLDQIFIVLMYIFVGAFLSVTYLTINMYILNIAYNIHKIRINSDALVEFNIAYQEKDEKQ